MVDQCLRLCDPNTEAPGSILELLRHHGMKAEARRLSLDELAQSLKEGTLEEVWGCGTAAVVSPVGLLSHEGLEYEINGGEIGPISQMLYDELTGIQWGKLPDEFGWIWPVC